MILGQEAVVVKNGSRLCGTGAARASTPILQNKAYWEVKIQQSGIWSCGVSYNNHTAKNYNVTENFDEMVLSINVVVFKSSVNVL